MSTHSICFCADIRKNIDLNYSLSVALEVVTAHLCIQPQL